MKARSNVLRALLVLVVLGSTPSIATTVKATASSGSQSQVQAVCNASADEMRCFALVTPGRTASRDGGGPPPGYGAPDIESAYKLPVSLGSGQTIAVVDAFDDPTAAADLAVYRNTYGLPPCTTASGCFRKLNQRGLSSHYPSFDPGWSVEISLDLDMVSAACPLCHIVLVEGNTPSIKDLAAAEDSAAKLNVSAISNSYGLQEFNGMDQFAKDYTHAGTTIVVSTGDFGFGPANFPAVLSTVIAVGGTELGTSTSKRGWSETVAPFAASGCSAYVNKPSWQKDNHCFMRTVADVSAVADNAAVYDTSIPPGFFGLQPGFIVVGGTSVSSPLIAGVIGLAGNGKTIAPSFPYQNRRGLFDVVGGSNGYCGGDYLCDGVRGYDGPTGLGTPKGVSGL
ncbi:MAG: S8 family serine peptidase [Actinomycetota bacterium]|nr:S8 family serine peptidase [Actinomycetota bacterium]